MCYNRKYSMKSENVYNKNRKNKRKTSNGAVYSNVSGHFSYFVSYLSLT